ncbi:hypothetical protein CVT25_012867 [Psilocybe cyanescens]|uniref:F-box domain-containing protein n=1 Tax=Psilocybe cyanescens TaxID=93625 RepID=A0A409XM00_PSICY|nr:hypothetical protein CVT25_012867 [Psilocybe cyanescens]
MDFYGLATTCQPLNSKRLPSSSPGCIPGVYDENSRSTDLTDLKSLTLRGPDSIFGLLSRTGVPNLTQLTLCHLVDTDRDDTKLTSEWTLDLLKHSSPPISLLELDKLPINHLAYKHILASLPLLETFSIHKSGVSEVSFQTSNRPNGLCPSLKRLDLKCCLDLVRGLFNVHDFGTIRQSMLEYEQEVEYIDRQIENYNRTIQQLLRRKEQRLADILRCKEKLTLANRLPIEILIQIFEQYILDDLLDKSSLKRGPLTVSHVCSRWRQASSDPMLWSHIHSDILITRRAAFSLINMWLSRSRDKPLTIELALSRLTSPIYPTTRAILEEISRWRHLRLKSRILWSLNDFLSACTDPAPQLRTIDIEVVEGVDPGSTEEEMLGLQEVFAGSPHIHTISITHCVLPNPMSLPVSVTHLSLKLPSQALPVSQQSILRMVSLLEQLPKLETLLIEVPLSHHTDFLLDAEDHHPVDLLNLTSLTLSGPGNIFGLLPRIKVPSLNHLVLSGSMETTVNQNTGEWLFHLLQESSPPISHLALVDLTIDDTMYIRLFASLPFLETLGVHDSEISDTAFQRLYGPNNLCPLLKRIDLRWCRKLSGAAIVDMIRGRSAEYRGSADSSTLSTPISEVTIIHCGLVSEGNISKLEELTNCRCRRHKYDDMCSQSFKPSSVLKRMLTQSRLPDRWRCCGSG